MLGVLASDAPLWSDEMDLESLLSDVRINMNSRAGTSRSAAALDSSRARSDYEDMNLLGRVENGVIVLDLPVLLSEGACVSVSFPAKPPRSARDGRPVALPIFDYDGPPDIDLTNERIAEILDRDDASA